jgi:hypothetical protein
MAGIAPDDALSLPYRANPRRMGFSGTTGARQGGHIPSTFRPARRVPAPTFSGGQPMSTEDKPDKPSEESAEWHWARAKSLRKNGFTKMAEELVRTRCGNYAVRTPGRHMRHIQRDIDSMNLRSPIAVTAAMLVQLQRVMDDPRFLLTGECEPLSAGRRVRIYARRGPYVCIYPEDTTTPCKWTHEKVLCASPERQRAGGEHQHQWAGSRAVHPVRSMVLVISSARSGVRG